MADIDLSTLITNEIRDIYQEWMTPVKREMNKRPIIFYWNESESLCPNCLYDTVNERSTGVYKPSGSYSGTNFDGICPICNGVGKIINTGSFTPSGGTIFYPNTASRQDIPGKFFDPSRAEISFTIPDIICNSGVYSGKRCYEFMDYVTFDGHKWVQDGLPREGGIGGPFIIDIIVARTDK